MCTIKFYDVKIDGELIPKYTCITLGKYSNYEDYKYYMKINDTKFIANKITISRSYIDDFLGKYDYDDEEYRQNVRKIENDFDKKVLQLFEPLISLFLIPNLAEYQNGNLTINYEDLNDHQFKIIFQHAKIKFYRNNEEVTKDIINNTLKTIAKEQEEQMRKSYDEEELNKMKETASFLFSRCYPLRIKKHDDLYEVGILLFSDDNYGKAEAILTCNNILYKD